MAALIVWGGLAAVGGLAVGAYLGWLARGFVDRGEYEHGYSIGYRDGANFVSRARSVVSSNQERTL